MPERFKWVEHLRNDGGVWFDLEAVAEADKYVLCCGETPTIEEYEDDGTGLLWGVPSDVEAEETPAFATREEAERHAIAISIQFARETIEDAEAHIKALGGIEQSKDGLGKPEGALTSETAGSREPGEAIDYRTSFSLDADFEGWMDSAALPAQYVPNGDGEELYTDSQMRKAFDAGAMVEHERKTTIQAKDVENAYPYYRAGVSDVVRRSILLGWDASEFRAELQRVLGVTREDWSRWFGADEFPKEWERADG